MSDIKVLGMCGSLRKASYNRMALNVAVKILSAHEGIIYKEANLKELNIPMYDGDIEAQGFPAGVVELKRLVAESDIILMASPEYNHSVTPALKNAIDWLSRDVNTLDKKWAVLFGVSVGVYGTVRGQAHLRQILAALNVYTLPQPQVLIKNSEQAFLPDASLSDKMVEKGLNKLITDTIAMVRKVKG